MTTTRRPCCRSLTRITGVGRARIRGQRRVGILCARKLAVMCESCGVDPLNPFSKPDAGCDDIWDAADRAYEQEKEGW